MDLDLTEYLQDQTAEETVEVLDEMLEILVLHSELVGLSDRFGHQYLTIKALRDLFDEMDCN